MGYTFAGVEKILWETFLLRLLFVKSKPIPPIVEILFMMLFKKYVLGLQYLVTSADNKNIRLLRASSELLEFFTGERAFPTADHLLALREERRDRQKRRDDTNGAKLKGLVKYIKEFDRRLILRSKRRGSWLTLRGTMVTGIVLAATEFCGFLCAYYDVTPTNLPIKHDGCSSYFSVSHIISCSNGGLVIVLHKKVHDELLYPA